MNEMSHKFNKFWNINNPKKILKIKTYNGTLQLGRMTKVWSQFQWYQFPIHYSGPENKLKFSRSAPVWIPKLQKRRIKVIKLKSWVDIDDPLGFASSRHFIFSFALKELLPRKQVFLTVLSKFSKQSHPVHCSLASHERKLLMFSDKIAKTLLKSARKSEPRIAGQ